VSELNKLTGVLGAKTSGGGPGGALVFSYKPMEICSRLIDFNELIRIIKDNHHKMLLGRVLKN